MFIIFLDKRRYLIIVIFLKFVALFAGFRGGNESAPHPPTFFKEGHNLAV